MTETAAHVDVLASVRSRWREFWFAPGSAPNLGMCRIVFYAALFVFYLSVDFTGWARLSPVFWRPLPLFRVLGLSQPSEPTVVIVQVLWKAALLLSCLGLFTRLATVTAFLLGTYLLSLAHCFGKVHHYDAILVLALAVMAASRCGDATSLDGWVRSARHRRASADLHAAGEYTWPVRLMWVVVTLTFFAAGISKLRESGLAWIASENLAITITQNYYHRASDDPLTTWGLVVAQRGWLSQLLAAATVVLETASPLALFSRVARMVLVPLLLVMLIAIRVLLGPSFVQFAIGFVFWVPWNHLIARLRR